MVQIKVSVALILTAAAAIAPVVAPPPPLDGIAVTNPPGSNDHNVTIRRSPGTPAVTHIHIIPNYHRVEFAIGRRNPRELHVLVPDHPGSYNTVGIENPEDTSHDVRVHHYGSGQVVEHPEYNTERMELFTVKSTGRNINSKTLFQMYHTSQRDQDLTDARVGFLHPH
jgi:hypothetical protein